MCDVQSLEFRTHVIVLSPYNYAIIQLRNAVSINEKNIMLALNG